MCERLKPFSVEKFVVHRRDPWKCGEFLHIVPQKFDTYGGETDSKTWIMGPSLLHYRGVHISSWI
jgi:hypothetical protein